MNEATRPIYWNIVGHNWMYALLAVLVAVLAWGVYERIRLWRLGRPELRVDQPWRRLVEMNRQVILQIRLLRDALSGPMHLFLSWGFVVLFLGTVVVFLQADLGLPVMRGPFYLYFQSISLDVFGALALIATVVAAWRRYVERLPRLSRTVQDWVILALFAVILLTGFVIEGLRIEVTRDPWGPWSPVGYLFGRALGSFLSVGAMTALHRGLWWFHLVIAFAFLALIPFSKLFHILLAPLNVYFRSLEPKGELPPLDVEAAAEAGEHLGAAELTDFTWKQLFDLDTCTECGRCEAVCPAHAVGKPLDPKYVILNLRDHLHAEGPSLVAMAARNGQAAGEGGAGGATATASGVGEGEPVSRLVGPVIDPEALWACTTCRACMEACPVFIEHVPTIVQMRRFQVMEMADYPATMQEALTSLEERGHPFRGSTASRLDWAEGMEVPLLSELGSAGQVDYLFWVGCSAAFDERNQKIARALATLLDRAGVRYAVLGDEERCTGDPARRMGNEFLFQMTAQENIDLLNRYGVRRIVTLCAHCYNVLRNEYPRFGGRYEVVHHSQLLQELLDAGRLEVTEPSLLETTYHDPCYLGRYNDEYEAPRAVLGAAVGGGVREMERSRNQSFCCGAGGGRMWAEEDPSQRVNRERARQALATGARRVCTACPFCMTMLEDGIKSETGGDGSVEVRDLAEILEEATRPKN
ncbi:MAG: heterodisulfide reductase-related iron-sulfur binding cluster [Bacillota bacterium]|nr:heterodisulfide reductase-related iron-sulfur binding cluster [Bacillota bacterium]